MGSKTYVYLLTGFLGAGKTTLLNRILKVFPKDKKLAILMNEFGEIGIDGTLVEGDEIDMIEISRGSIFCVCVKSDFIKGLYELGQKIQPDVLLIESTGVANPTDLKRDLKLPVFKDRYELKEQFCIIDAQHFLDAYGAYTALDKQIQSSTVFIINKVESATPQAISRIKEIILAFNPSPRIYETSYCDVPIGEFFPFELLPDQEPSQYELPELTDQELERIVEESISSPGPDATPPDPMLSYTMKWEGHDLKDVRELAMELPKDLPRAKGFFKVNDKIYLLNFVMGDWTLEEYPMPSGKKFYPNILVLIGRPELQDRLLEIGPKHSFMLTGTVMPFERVTISR